MNMQLLETLQDFYKTEWADFINDMAEGSAWDRNLSHKLNRKIMDLTQTLKTFIGEGIPGFMECIREMDPEVHKSLSERLMNLKDTDETFFDIFDEHNNIHRSKVVIPGEVTKELKIIR